MYGNIREDTNEALQALLGSVNEAFAVLKFKNDASTWSEKSST